MKFMQYINVCIQRFLHLKDTPSSYSGQGGKFVAVKSTADGLEFVDAPAGGVDEFIELTDTPSEYTGQGGKVVKVKSDASGLEFADESGGGASAPTTISSTTTNDDNGTNHTHALDDLHAAAITRTLATVTIDKKGRVTALSSGSSPTIYSANYRQNLTNAAYIRGTSLQYSISANRSVRFTWVANNGSTEDFGQMMYMKMPDNSYRTIVILANSAAWVTQSMENDASYIYGRLDFSPAFTGQVSYCIESLG